MTWPAHHDNVGSKDQPLKVVESQKRIVATEHSNEGSLRLSEQRRCHLEIVLQAPPRRRRKSAGRHHEGWKGR